MKLRDVTIFCDVLISKVIVQYFILSPVYAICAYISNNIIDRLHKIKIILGRF